MADKDVAHVVETTLDGRQGASREVKVWRGEADHKGHARTLGGHLGWPTRAVCTASGRESLNWGEYTRPQSGADQRQ